MRTLTRCVLGLGLSLSAPVLAGQRTATSSLAPCTRIASPERRLACYDSIAGRAAQPAPAPVPATGLGAWDVSDTTNPLNDSRQVILGLASSSGQSKFGRPIVLILRCRDQKVEVFINWDSYLSDDGGRVTVRVGSDEAKTSQWQLSSDKEATFYPGDAGQFVQRLTAAPRLVAQTTPYEESPIMAIFDLTGLPKAVQPFAEACKL